MKKKFLLLCSINWSNFIVWLSLLCDILGNMHIANVCKLDCDAMNFEVNLIFLISLFSLHDQKILTKTEISWEWNELLRWNKKHFSSILKGFQSSKQHNFFGGWESDFKVNGNDIHKIQKNSENGIWRPYQLGIAFYHLAKLIITKNYQDFLDIYLDWIDFQLILKNTINFYKYHHWQGIIFKKDVDSD